ncbi:MAG: hypothetical protein QOE54_875 [Streptosporangiaceae bacterium]|nr:hypothetical protein [Streptosporangiaceae bacterium]MDX6428509.1 hypothetical protein [Streptosporangiaceae bacterium]
MESWEQVARELIRDTVAAYTHSGDRGQVARLAECFTADGVLEIKGREPAEGRGAIVAMLTGAVERGSAAPADGRPGFVRHFVTNLRFDELTPQRARTSAYFLVLTADGPDHWGRYRDVLVPVGERWLIAHRLVGVDAAAEVSPLA